MSLQKNTNYKYLIFSSFEPGTIKALEPNYVSYR